MNEFAKKILEVVYMIKKSTVKVALDLVFQGETSNSNANLQIYNQLSFCCSSQFCDAE